LDRDTYHPSGHDGKLEHLEVDQDRKLHCLRPCTQFRNPPDLNHHRRTSDDGDMRVGGENEAEVEAAVGTRSGNGAQLEWREGDGVGERHTDDGEEAKAPQKPLQWINDGEGSRPWLKRPPKRW